MNRKSGSITNFIVHIHEDSIQQRHEACFIIVSGETWLSPGPVVPDFVCFSAAGEECDLIPQSPNVCRDSAERRHGPLLDIGGTVWILLQGLHDLTVVQHESHELVFPLSFGRGAVDRPDQLQLLQVLEGLRVINGKGTMRGLVEAAPLLITMTSP